MTFVDSCTCVCPFLTIVSIFVLFKGINGMLGAKKKEEKNSFVFDDIFIFLICKKWNVLFFGEQIYTRESSVEYKKKQNWYFFCQFSLYSLLLFSSQ